MTRLGNKLFSSVLALLTSASLLAGCGGGGSHVSAVPQAQPTTSSSAAYTGPLSDATFKITIPVPTTSAKARRPAYVSSSTTKIVFTLNSDTVGLSGAALTTFNTANLGAKAVTLGSATCPGGGPWTCTLTIKLPPGTDNVTMSAQDASSNILSQQIQNFTVVAGVANSFTTTLDANAATISLSGTQACTAGSIQGVFGTVGTTPVTIGVTFTDPATKTIIAPGLPIIAIQDNTATFQTSSGTINGTGGTVSFTINQAAQSFTLTPSTVPISNASVVVHGTAANTNTASDGLAFTQSHTFAFSAGTAPPAHNFLAVIEQSGAPTTGQINFYNVTLGGSGGADTIAAFSTATLASTPSISTPSQPDVDGPLDLIWDSGGNLLIANGGQGGVGGDFGNFACVPAGAISTGANLATTDSTNMRVPSAIALASNGTVALGNNPASAAKNVEEFTLSTNYVPGSSLTNPGSFGIPLGRPLVNLPSLAAGTFAVGLYDGTNSKVDILGPTGTLGTITNSGDTNLNDPQTAAWDGTNNQLVVATNNGCSPPASGSSFLEFYTVSAPPAAPVKVGGFMIQQNPNGGNPYSAMVGSRVAVSANGTIAVAGVNCDNSASGLFEVQIYSSNATPGSRTSLGVIPFDTLKSADVSGCNDFTVGDYTYGLDDLVQDMKWLSNTKLEILLSDQDVPANQGIYIYDISATASPGGFWCSGAAPSGPKKTGFLSLGALVPHSSAFKP